MTVRQSRTRPICTLAVGAVMALIALAIPLALGDSLTAAYADGSAQTVTGKDFAWDVVNNQLLGSLPTATASQTQDLVDQSVHVTWTGFTPSSNGEFDPAPTPGVAFQQGNTLYAVGVYECRGASPKSLGSCYLTQGGSTIGAHGLGNAVRTVSQADGTGFADLHVETGVDNDLLGCDSTHPCSVAVLPAWGGYQPASTEPTRCDDHSVDYPTAANGYDGDTFAADQFLGARCSWANRLVIPLHFAATPQDCPRRGPSFSAAGSPMLQRAMQQWRAGWCHGSDRLTFDFNSTNNEYQARSAFLTGSGALTASTDVAFTSQPADGGDRNSFTYAPIANTDIAIAFVIDDPRTGKLIPDITLDARLVAKMLTQSYAPYNYSCLIASTVRESLTCDPAVRGNPNSILQDPEFLALNPKLTAADFPYSSGDPFGAFFPTVVSGNSDLTYELTSWINSDPQARAFLQGQLDPWGMHINSYYQGIHYPTSQFQELDPGFVDKTAPAGNGTMQNTWQPINGLDEVGTLLAGNTATALGEPVCAVGTCSIAKLTEQYGERDLFAILDQAQASAYAFPVAHLVNAAGKAVAPDTNSVTAGLASMRPNADGVTRAPNFASANPNAYPLTTVDYAMVRTCGMTHAKAAAVSAMLDKVSQSQLYGTGPGTIAVGYLGLNDAQLAHLSAASNAVAAQACPTHASTGSGSSSKTGANGGPPTPQRSGTGNANSSGAVRSSNQGGGNGNAVDSAGPAAGGNASMTRSGSTRAASNSASPAGNQTSSSVSNPIGAARPVALGVTNPDSAGAVRYTLPILLALGGLALIGAPLAYCAVATGLGATARRWMRTTLARVRR